MPTQAYFQSGFGLVEVDWARVDATTDEEILAQAASDEDTAPVLSESDVMASTRKREAHSIQDTSALGPWPHKA